MILPQFPIISMISMLFCGLASAIFNKKSHKLFLSIGFSLVSIILLWYSSSYITEYGNINYSFGNFGKYGISFKIDHLNIRLSAVTILASLWFLIYSKLDKIFPLINIITFGAIGLLYTNDIFNAYVFIEVISIASYAIASCYHNDKPKHLYCFNYLIYGSIAATIYLLFIAFIYSFTGHLNIDQISLKLYLIPKDLIIISLYIFIFAIFMKIGFFPLHFYLKDLYGNINANIAMFLSSMSSGVYAYFILKIINSLYTNIIYATYIKDLTLLMLFVSSLYYCYIMIRNNYNYENTIAYLAVMSVLNYIVCIMFINNNWLLFLSIFISDIITKMAIFKYKDTNKYFYKLLIIFLYVGMPFTIMFFTKWKIIEQLYNLNNYFALISLIILWFCSFYGLFKSMDSQHIHHNNPKYFIPLLLLSLLLGSLWI